MTPAVPVHCAAASSPGDQTFQYQRSSFPNRIHPCTTVSRPLESPHPAAKPYGSHRIPSESYLYRRVLCRPFPQRPTLFLCKLDIRNPFRCPIGERSRFAHLNSENADLLLKTDQSVNSHFHTVPARSLRNDVSAVCPGLRPHLHDPVRLPIRSVYHDRPSNHGISVRDQILHHAVSVRRYWPDAVRSTAHPARTARRSCGSAPPVPAAFAAVLR